MILFPALVLLLQLVAALPVHGAVPSPHAPSVELLHHDLTVTLVPDRHVLQARDSLTLKVSGGDLPRISLRLNEALRVRRAVLESRKQAGTVHVIREQDPNGDAQAVLLGFQPHLTAGEVVRVAVEYEGEINDPPREARQLRFVTPSETAGHIGPEGVYLSGETHWYPELSGSLSTFWVRVTLPDGWHSVTHGRRVETKGQAGIAPTEWEVAEKTEALTLVANRFVVAQRQWNGIGVAAYLFPEDAALASEYLDASIRYLATYTKLLGPYPYPKFAVVENFFASGLGMPSFTLLGSGVIKRHYVQAYALGHEIVHSWIGNWVFNRTEDGNWVEGLTTYLANYYYEELTGTSEQSREQRRLMVVGYAVYVDPDQDYPVARFTHKTDQKDNAIGYQKAAMVFHMLRTELGDEVFWPALRGFVGDYGGRYAQWRDLEAAFSTAAGKDLRWFFSQWVERAGAPRVELTHAEPLDSKGPAVRLRISQAMPPYTVSMKLRVDLSGGEAWTTWLRLDSTEHDMIVSVPARPIAVSLDPDFDTFRRIERRHLVPMLNLFVTDARRVLVLPDGGEGAARAPYLELAERVMSEAPHRTATYGGEALGKASVLVLGGPGTNSFVATADHWCGEQVEFRDEGVRIAGQTYRSPKMAALVSCRRPESPDQVVSVFYGASPDATAKVARLLFFYGWQSYVIFDDGRVVARGDFPPADPLTRMIE
ncbi:M1 family metallopeptidase [Candidatus Nitrospira bockiana]